MQKKQPFNIYLQLIFFSNLFPIYCVYKYGWTFFEVLWLYIVEAVILIIYDAARLLAAQVNKRHHNFKLAKAVMTVKLIIRRLLIILFYSIFAIVFIGLLANKGANNFLQIAQTIGFQNQMFNYALLSFFVTQYYRYAFNYIANDLYLREAPESYNHTITATSLVLHVVIVLGTVGNAFLNKENNYDANKMILVIFIVVKTIAAFVQYQFTKSETQYNQKQIYI